MYLFKYMRKADNGSIWADDENDSRNLWRKVQALGWLNWRFVCEPYAAEISFPSYHTGLKKGLFLESNSDLKSYVFCVAQMSGILSKKNEINEQKMLSQIDNLLPPELKQHTLDVWNACKAKQQGIPDKYDRIFILTKCFYDFNPAKFVFP